MSTEPITVDFKTVTPKKHVIRFDSDGEIVTSIYVSKDAFDGKTPKSISVTITPVFEAVAAS